METREEPTTTQRCGLEHLRRAAAQSVSLVDYARAAGLKVGSLWGSAHAAKQESRAGGPSSAIAPSPAQMFIPVQVIAPGSNRREGRTGSVCQLRHPDTGRVIERSNYPELTWVRGLLGS